MQSKYDMLTKEKRSISSSQITFMTTTLYNLGFTLSNNGSIYLKKLIIFAYENDYITINYTKICNDFAITYNLKYKTIYENIKYTFSNINLNKSRQNFENIFKYEYNNSLITPKKIILFILDILDLQ